MAILYGIIFAILAISFWLFYDNSQMAMFHVIAVQYVTLPILFLFSLLWWVHYIYHYDMLA